jgi:hypothetical protein
MIAEQEAEGILADDIAALSHNPLGFVMYAFPWGEGALEGSAGPRVWQRETLQVIGEHLQNPATRNQPLLLAIASGHDIGKTALISMIINWGMSTCEDCKIVVTASTAGQLDTKTVPEVQKWIRMAANSHWWDVFATSIRVKDPNRESQWRTDFIPWSIQRADAFQGLHNLRKRIIVIFDEASGIAPKIYEATQGVLLDEDTEILWIAFGNPTQNSGPFADIFGKNKHRWKTRHIDSRKVEGTNKEQIQRWIEDYGEDSDFVRVRVRGEFPRAASNQFIPSDIVAECRKYKAQGWEQFPKILGVDVARFGDDQTVLFLRQGRRTCVLLKTRGLSTAQVTDRVIDFIEREEIDAVVVDSDGIGAPVYDQLVARGYSRKCHEFHGGQPANDRNAYFNRRAEIWGLLRDALKAGLEIPDDPELESDLTGPQYGFSSGQQVQLEKKDDMKKRGLASPDMGDALAMTFAIRLAARTKSKIAKPNLGNESWME